MQIDSKTRQKVYFLLLVATAFTAIAAGLSEGTFNNFYADVYNVTARQRGFIEFPREIPGLIAVLVISLMSFMGEIKLAIVAQILSITGLILLGVFTPPFALMLVFLFVNSMGMHLYMPLKDSIGLYIIGDENTASKFGVLNGVRTGAGFLAALVIFIGARFGWFSFTNHAVIRHFLIATLFFVVVVLILIKIMRLIGNPKLSVSMAVDEESEKDRSLIMRHVRKRFIFRKEYKFYYMLAALHGAHKQIWCARYNVYRRYIFYCAVHTFWCVCSRPCYWQDCRSGYTGYYHLYAVYTGPHDNAAWHDTGPVLTQHCS